MDKLPVGQLPDLQQSNNDDEIMVITNSEYSQLKKEKISDLITDFTSTNENNALTKGTDGKLFVTDFGNASNITEGTLPVSVLPDIPKDKLPEIETDDLPDSGITAGTYTYPTDIVVNSKGQVTSITEGQAGANNANQDLSNLGPLGLDKLNQSKALETGNVSSDADVYADVLSYKNSSVETGIDTVKPDEYTVTGTPSISETGIASNLGNGNKIQCNTFTLADLKNKSWRVECEINVVDLNTSDTANISTYLLKFCDNWHTYGSITCVYNSETNRFSFRLNTRVDDNEGWYCNTTTPVLTEDIKRLKIIATFEKDTETQNYKIKVFNADTGEQLGNTGSYTPATEKKELDIIDDLPTQSPLLGESSATTNWTTYDLNTYKFYIEDKLVWQPCLKIPYTLSKTGSKIVDAAYRDRVQDVYEQYGVAMYYTLDEENRNFTLPMGEIYGMIEKKADFLNNPYSLLDVKWSDKLLNNISWLRSNGQSNSGNVYVDVYNLILSEYNDSSDEQETIGETSITFRRGSKTGIKVTTDKTSYDAILSETGTAWYYVLDTANKAFYLPQTNGFMQFGGTGEFVDAGLPNIEGSHGGLEGVNFYTSGAFSIKDTTQRGGAGNGAGDCYVSFDASLSNPIYGNSETVQPNAIKGYLYFYVGETVQNANLINAGVLSEKANADLSNCTKPYVTETYVNGTSWYRLWSDGWCEQGGQTAALSASTQTTIELLKEYSNTDYFINVNQPLRIGDQLPTVGIYQKNTANFIVHQSSSSNRAGAYATLWYACGF